MSPSADCVAMVRAVEGFAATAYPDGAYHSIGYGHHGPEVAVGSRITQDEVLRYLNAGEHRKAAGEFKRWNRVRGIPVSGLTARRAKEEALFRKGE